MFACAFSPNGCQIISGSIDHNLKLWNIATGKEIIEIKLDGDCRCIDWSRNWRIVVGTGLGRVQLIQLKNLPLGTSVVTAWMSQMKDTAFACPYCRTWSSCAKSDLDQIVSCPKCGKSLKLNPFIIQADWRPIVKAWESKQIK